jgi:hypothetical protein
MSILNDGGVDMSFKVSWKLHIVCFLLAYAFCYIEQNRISDLFVSLLSQNELIDFTGNTLMYLIIFLIVIFIPITFVHELLHGAVYKLFGGKIRFGFKGVYAYAQETSGIALHRTKFLLVLLAPVTIISLTSVFIPEGIGGIVFLLNLLGSTGDLLMAFYLCKGNENSYVVDKSYGFDIINKENKNYTK